MLACAQDFTARRWAARSIGVMVVLTLFCFDIDRRTRSFPL